MSAVPSVKDSDLANAIRALAMDAVEAAKSGHPGMPMGMAEIAVALWTRHLRAQPGEPALARPRPLRAEQRPRLDAAVRARAPRRLRPAARGAAPLPAAGLEDAGAPGGRRHPGRGDHHRPARPGARQRAWAWRSPRSCSPRRSIATATRSSTTAPGCSRATAASWKASRTRPARSPARWGLGEARRVLRRQRHLHRRQGRRLVHRRHARRASRRTAGT